MKETYMTGIVPENSINDKVDKLQQELLELSKIFELTRIINYASDIAVIGDKLVEFIKSEFSSENVVFFIKEDHNFRVMSSIGINLSNSYEFKNCGEGIWKIINGNKSFCVLDDFQNNIYSQFFQNYKLSDLNTSYIIPFTYNGVILALIMVSTKKNQAPYSDFEVKLFNKISEIFSPALNKYRIEEEKERTSNKLQKTLHNISILYNIGLAINFIDDLKKLLKVILDMPSR